MARFLAPEAFSAATETISLLPFSFERTGTYQYLVANMVGDFIRLTEDEINKLIDLRVTPGDGLYESLLGSPNHRKQSAGTTTAVGIAA
ncbi:MULTISPECIES: hypothetical protein [unclassified Bradyrhizobium]|uniref:hypothetical protein n=1 Tax=unclassified Bradyrhizobium TaxID=2631580 RepID=UPI0018DE8193|nr:MULTISPECIES: hypothetical protein [unclassified Bradyrhizobium]